MNILLISYGIKEYDGRLAEIYSVSKYLGNNITLVCCGKFKSDNNKEIIIDISKKKYLSYKSYLSFVYNCLKISKEMAKIDVLFVDNFFAAIPALIIKLIFRPKYVVQDVRELYYYKDMKSKLERIFCRSEINLMKRANVVLCANKYRSSIMYETYKLKKHPLVFENIRFLTGEYDKKELNKKYKNMFNYKINIISTGGISITRKTDKLVYCMTKLPEDYGLFIVGEIKGKDMKILEEIIEKYNIGNVTFINKVPLPELRYIIQQCDIGVVNYHKNDLNNKYCASGKVYEYLAEGLPIVTTENIPLKELCEKYEIGEADDNFYDGISKVSNNLSEYKKRVNSFIARVSVKKYNKNIAKNIMQSINSEDVYIDE